MKSYCVVDTQGVLHRINGPAVEFPSGYAMWFVNGKQHRTDGPAVQRDGGYAMWYVNDTRVCSATEFQQLTNITDDQLALLVLKYGDIC